MPRALRRVCLIGVLLVVAFSAMAHESVEPGGRRETPGFWPGGPGHNHSDPAQHAGFDSGLCTLSHRPLPKRAGEIDVAADAAGRTWIAVGYPGGGAFGLIDATNPLDPIVVHETVLGSRFYVGDVKFSQKADLLFVGVQPLNPPEPGLAQTLLDAIRGIVAPSPPPEPILNSGVRIYDVRDKSDPVYVGVYERPAPGAHMLDVEHFEGRTVLVSAASAAGAGIGFATVDDNGAVTPRSDVASNFTHDATLAPDPLDASRLLATLATWDEGVSFYDATEPETPVRLGGWRAPTESGGKFHTVMAFALEGRRVVAASQEHLGSATETSPTASVYFLDATDFADVRMLGRWSNPDANAGSGWSTHNVQVSDGRLYLAHYHGGALVLDVSSLGKLVDPPVLARLLPTGEGLGGTYAPYTWDFVPQGGRAWASDANSGLYALSAC